MVGTVLYKMVGLSASITSLQRFRARLLDGTGEAGLRGMGGRAD